MQRMCVGPGWKGSLLKHYVTYYTCIYSTKPILMHLTYSNVLVLWQKGSALIIVLKLWSFSRLEIKTNLSLWTKVSIYALNLLKSTSSLTKRFRTKNSLTKRFTYMLGTGHYLWLGLGPKRNYFDSIFFPYPTHVNPKNLFTQPCRDI